MARGDDFSSAHFDWLVAGRSRNQQATPALYKLIEVHEKALSRSFAARDAAHALVGIAFSLWRAVFLSDLTGDVDDQLTDAKRFLQSLIAHNSVLYQTDFSAREWTFTYYLGNAVSRIDLLPSRLVPDDAKSATAETAKDAWTNAQATLELAITKFAEMIADSSP